MKARDADLDYDVAVVGSGFGGSVAALRLSQKGYRVVVIEAGRRWQRDDFPKTNWNLPKMFWVPALGWLGLQRMTLLPDALVLAGAGVGGGSLVYGNTLFEPNDDFFALPSVQTVGGAQGLKPYYALARKMMGVVTNPYLTPMDAHVRETAAEMGRGDTFTPSPIAVYCGAPGAQPVDPYFLGEGPARSGCVQCGGCFLGCRHGAKNTLDQNYLYFAEKLGCEIVSERIVETIQPVDAEGAEGYVVDIAATTGFRRRRRRLRVGGVVVAAGVMGSVRLLLDAKRRGHLPQLSPQLGGGVRTNSESIIAVRSRQRDVDFSRGVAASSSVFLDDHTQVQADRMPAGADQTAFLATLMVDGGGRLPRWLRWMGVALKSPLDLLRTLWPFGFAKQSVLLVVMQTLEGALKVEQRRRWLPPFGWRLTSRPEKEAPTTYIPQGHDFARRLAQRIDGVPQSSVNEVLLNRPATAHIMGGCLIGEDATSGVIDADQRVYGYRNLWVCDGSVIPANLGVNPALSILAFSERAMAAVPPKAGADAALKFLAVDRHWDTTDLLCREPSQNSQV